jgi:hypothetical protein
MRRTDRLCCASHTVISRRGNEGIFRDMMARAAPNFPDALARNRQPLKFVPVDEQQMDNAKKYCAANARTGIYTAGCPAQYSRDPD